MLLGEQLGYRYEVVSVVDQGSFGQVVKCIDHGHPQHRIVAAKISKKDVQDVDNMIVEVRFLQSLGKRKDEVGGDRIVEYIEHFKFRGHIIIVFEFLHLNLFRFVRS